MIDVKKEGVLTSGLDMRAGERCPYILPGGEKRVEVSIEGKEFWSKKHSEVLQITQVPKKSI